MNHARSRARHPSGGSSCARTLQGESPVPAPDSARAPEGSLRLPFRKRKASEALLAHSAKLRSTSLTSLFAEDAGRAERFTSQALGLYVDYAKQRIDAETLPLLLQLAKE